jgi:hypothetical protein
VKVTARGRGAEPARSPCFRTLHPKCIQAQLGHASIQKTLDRYGI